MPGNRSWNVAIASGMSIWPRVEAMPTLRTPPRSPTMSRNSCSIERRSAWKRRAYPRNFSPDAVSAMGTLRRTSLTPSSRSTFATWADNVCWVMPMRSAARVKLRSSASATK